MAQTKAQNAANQQRVRARHKARLRFSADMLEKLENIREEMSGEIGDLITFSVSMDTENITVHWRGEDWAYKYLDKMCLEAGFSFGLVQLDIDLIIVERIREKLRFETINLRPRKGRK